MNCRPGLAGNSDGHMMLTDRVPKKRAAAGWKVAGRHHCVARSLAPLIAARGGRSHRGARSGQLYNIAAGAVIVPKIAARGSKKRRQQCPR